MAKWSKQYPVGTPMRVPVEVAECQVKVIDGVVVNHFENRISHESGVVVQAAGQYINVPGVFLDEDGEGSVFD